MTWKPISELPEKYQINRKMFVVIGIDICPVSPDHKYTSDPVCVWMDEGCFMRWSHNVPPTHFCELPAIDNRS